MGTSSHSTVRTPNLLTPWGLYGTGLIALGLTVLIVMYPKPALDASVFGLKLWFDVVLPALFPFFTMSEILMGLGVIRFAGVLMEPAMRPLFRIPGVGGFVVAIGLASGYPLGAKMTGQVCRQGLCTSVEGERLISFANTADPLFIFGAVAIGMFQMPEVGAPLVAAHYLAVLVVGFIMRYHGGGKMGPPEQRSGGGTLTRAMDAMRTARTQDGRPIGQLFGDAVRSSLQSMLFIGGSIMMFSVFLEILRVSGIVAIAASFLTSVLAPFNVGADLVQAIMSGFVEITMGADAAGRAQGATLMQKVVVASGIIGWSGLGVHAQVAAMIHGTGIRLGPYVGARFLHGVLAGVIAWLLMGPLEPVIGPLVTPVFAPLTAGGIAGFWTRLTTALTLVLGLTFTVAVVSTFISMKRRITGIWVVRR